MSTTNQLFARLIPKRAKWRLHQWLKNSSGPIAIGSKSEQVRSTFDILKRIPGWFTLDDCSHFHLVLEMQSLHGQTGDMLEIGSYHGRSTALMAKHLRPGETIHVCDAFEADTEDRYAAKPSPENLLNNLRKVTPNFSDSQVVIHECLSNDLKLPAEQKFRFIHVDGGHSAEQVYADLELSAQHLLPKGVVVIDDYKHAQWPDVAVGVDRYLKEHPEFSVLGDMNRHGALGRKLYITRD